MPALFITATGTEIGKTYITSGLAAQWRREGRNVCVLKPVLSGFDPDAFEESDAALLLRACGRKVDEQAIAAISPWRFRAPLSPDMAARREHRSIDFAELVQFCRQAIATNEDILLIEGIGGLMVPLDTKSTVLDLIVELAIPSLVVAGTYLGSLSHVLTALAAARMRAIEVGALVLNQSADLAVPIDETRATLENFCPTLPILCLKRGNEDENGEGFARLARLCCERALK